jgi:hypothetical protein
MMNFEMIWKLILNQISLINIRYSKIDLRTRINEWWILKWYEKLILNQISLINVRYSKIDLRTRINEWWILIWYEN